MPEWLVRLKGDPFDLEELSSHMVSAERNVRKDEDGFYYLRSSDFAPMTDREAVRDRALELIERINGVASFYAGDSYQPVEFDGMSKIGEDGKRESHVFLPFIDNSRSRVFGNLAAASQAGPVTTSRSSSAVDTLIDLADQNEGVADALRFYERGDWFNLYKAWEVVCDAAGGTHAVVRNGWADDAERGRFTGTVQSRDELGDDARHASERYMAPKDPMTLEEARGFVRAVIQAWIRSL